MAKAIPFTLITPNAVAFNGQATLVIATSTEGEIGILAGHTPYLTALKPGVLRADVTTDGGATHSRLEIAISAGFMQALPHEVAVLVDTAVRVEGVDADLTRAELKAAQERQRDAGADRSAYAREQEVIDFAEAKLALAH